MAFWGSPYPQEDHAHSACCCALEMIASLEELNRKWAEQGRRPIAIGIGLNTGECCVGNMGSAQRLNYSVLGDAVNLASRLEGQSKTYHLDLVIGETTYQGVQDMATIELDLIQVKGKTVPVRIFTLVGDETVAATPEYQALRRYHDEMLACFRAQDWPGARAALQQCMPLAPGFGIEALYEVYEERIQGMELEPPGDDWDGVYVAKTK